METRETVFNDIPSFLKEGESTMWPVSLKLPWPVAGSFLPTIYDRSVPVLTLPELPRDEDMEERCRLLYLPRTYQITACPHTDKKHYAKNMCSNCYHKHGRGNYARSCPHKDKPLYARGKCQSCYLHQYHRSRVFGRRRRVKKQTASDCVSLSQSESMQE